MHLNVWRMVCQSLSHLDNDLEAVDPKRRYEQFALRGLKYGAHF